jgi:hypothetical protein
MTRQTAAASRSGSAAFKSGKPLEANPYNKATSSHFAWMVAWINAKLSAAEAATKETVW